MAKPRKHAVKPITDPVLADQCARAKELYMQYVPVADIVARITAPEKVIRHWIAAASPITWAMERKERERSLFEETFAAKKVLLARVAGTSLTLIQKGLAHLADRPTPPSIDETKRVAEIYANLDRIIRLDAGGPTAINQVTVQGSLRVSDLRDFIKTDPVFSGALPPTPGASPVALPAPNAEWSELEADAPNASDYPEPPAKPLDPVEAELAEHDQ
jgi:hypothetical protein